ncbi:MAG TPA: hypothetical protein DDX07_08005 [Porphyromonadaceae bacterium]|jgi:hypothetical protein|nr:hypothetical protein [Porphyromonadaceae bacterium]
MQFTAKLVEILPLQTGKGRNGEWKKQDIIVETPGQYPKKVCVSVWGDKLDGVTLKQGQAYDISFDIESREFNGRWYTDVKAWKITPESNSKESVPPEFMDELPADAFPPAAGYYDEPPF